MRIFITGVAGFLGSRLAEKLRDEGHAVSGCDNLLGGYPDNVPAGVEFYKADARDLDAMRHLLKGQEVLFHLAAAPHEGLSVFSPSVITSHTYVSTVAATTAAIAEGVRRIVFCSSMSRYGVRDGQFTEAMEPSPVDPYGVAKYASEMTVQTLAAAHGFEYVIAVPHNIYGPRQKYDDPYRNVVAIMANRMLQGKQPYIYGTGEQVRCFTYVDDAVAPLAKMASEASVCREVVNIGPDEDPVTINRLARTVAEAVGFELDPLYVAERPSEVKHASCSAEKARKLLGYKTTVALAEGVRKTVEWIRERGPRPFEYHLPLEIVTEKTPTTWSRRLM